eukprot:6620103-Lingulodinium_polyedra.AAC.1
MAQCVKDRDPDVEQDGVLPDFKNSYPVAGDNRFLESNHWHPPHSQQQGRKDPAEQLSTRGRR